MVLKVGRKRDEEQAYERFHEATAGSFFRSPPSRKGTTLISRIRKSIDKRDGGFTLIELLVVMIIIGILAAIAIPVFLNQQKKARESSAKADVTTIGKEIAAFYVDGTGTLTAAGATAGGTWTLTDAATPAVQQGSGKLSTGNVVTPSTITSNTSFCVAVTTSDSVSWKYNQAGLGKGAC